MKINIFYILFLCVPLLGLSSCGGDKAQNKEETAHEEGEHGNESTTTLTAAQIKQIGLTYTSVSKQVLSDGLVLNGQLSVPNDKKAYVTSVFGGVLQQLFVQPGDLVTKGQRIGVLNNPDLIKTQEQLQLTNNQIRLTEIEVARQKELVEGNAAPLKRLQQVEMELANLKAQRSSLSKQLTAGGGSTQLSSQVSIIAPISGTVSTISAQIGSKVDASSPILELVNNDALHVDVFVYEKDLDKIKKGQKIRFSTVNNPNTSYEARIDQIGQAFETSTNAVAVHAQVLGDKSGLINGMQVQANLITSDNQVEAVPNESIVSFQGQDFIFILTDAHREEEHHEHGHGDEAEEHAHSHADQTAPEEQQLVYERISVVKGVSSGGYTSIIPTKEIGQDTKIVQKGAFFLLAKMTNSGEHSH
ncbi:efflux RND transporter periplasmic adaptor subunit [Sphingobacterium sp. SYP-B4668]|uniref:efflux RND transporter periplasmic adaptor subunit n=1 Tax=Sphingobacterium sp. SYP-B4668 TaxID=2996035 RepID=UPI0022DD0C1A|nr:efflux RND transporter periplasmic adaptor subunit [Sphingobacterium sp. SYP-B4668]